MKIKRAAAITLATALSLLPVDVMADLPRGEPPAAPADAPRPYRPNRGDLAFAYLRFERALAAHPPRTPDEIERLGRAFDRATFSFFAGGVAQTVRLVNELTDSVLPAPDGALNEQARSLARSFRAAVEPGSVIRGTDAPVLVVERMYDVDEAARDAALQQPLAVLIRIANVRTGEPAGAVEVLVRDAGEAPVRIPFPEVPRLAPGSYDVQVSLPGDHPRTTSRLFVVERPLDLQREEFLSRADALAGDLAPDLAPALAVFRSRAALLTDRPSPNNSSQFLAHQPELAAELHAELIALSKGDNPYRNRPGDLWRTFPLAETSVPVRIYCPPAVAAAAARGETAPLVIALHGAGGDENMFPDAYGAGVIKALADEHGFVLASPLNGPTASMPVFFDALVEALAADYPVRAGGVLVLGHSMGAGVTGAWAKLRHDRIAAAACIAGFTTFRAGQPIPPVLVAAAEFDALIPLARIERPAKDARAAGLPVEYRLIEREGHTTVVGRVLPEVIEWLLSHRRSPQNPAPAPETR